MDFPSQTLANLQSISPQQLTAEKAQELQARIEQNPQDALAHYLLGIYHYFQGNVGSSIEWLRKSLKLDPKLTDAAICLSVLLNDIGKYEEAKQVFDQANQSIHHKSLTGDPEVDRRFSFKHLELADLYFRYRRFDEAIEEYSKALHLDPSSSEVRIRRAKAYAKKGFITRAIQELQQLKQEKPADLTPRVQLGLFYYSQGNLLDAELEWEGILQLQPDHPEALAYLEMAKQQRLQPVAPGTEALHSPSRLDH